MAQSQKTNVPQSSKKLQMAMFYGGIALSAAIFSSGYWLDFPLAPSLSTVDKLVYTCRWGLLMSLVLMCGIYSVGRARGHCAAVDPLSGNEHLVQLQKNFLQNSLEQFLVAFIGLLVLSTYLETAEQLKVIPLFAINFIVARILFRIGYGNNPDYRGAGMVMTFFPSAIVAGFDLYFMMTKGFMFTAEDRTGTLTASFAQAAN